jgi:hypothetical protein
MEKTAEIPFLTVFYFFNKIENSYHPPLLNTLLKKAEKSEKTASKFLRIFHQGMENFLKFSFLTVFYFFNKIELLIQTPPSKLLIN